MVPSIPVVSTSWLTPALATTLHPGRHPVHEPSGLKPLMTTVSVIIVPGISARL
jgi:hypothetical protein